MAFTSGTATNQQDLLSQLFTFATANGWTQDEFDTVNNVGSLHNTVGNNVFVHFGWEGTEGGGPDNIAMCQSLGFAGTSLNIDGHTNDSGQGVSFPGGTTILSAQRRVSRIGNGPFTAHHFFSDLGPDYIYVILEYASGLFRHFGFGELNKIGDWTGGEWVGGHVWDEDGVQDDNPISGTHSILLDGQHTSVVGTEELDQATLHIEGLPNQGGAPGRWGVVGNSTVSTWQGTDGDGQVRETIVGPVRGGFAVREYGWLNASLLNGFVPMIPMPVVYTSDAGTPDHHIILGHMPNIRHIQMGQFTVGQSVVVGADTWRIYPGVRKRFLSDNQSETRNMGLAYLEVP